MEFQPAAGVGGGGEVRAAPGSLKMLGGKQDDAAELEVLSDTTSCILARLHTSQMTSMANRRSESSRKAGRVSPCGPGGAVSPLKI